MDVLELSPYLSGIQKVPGSKLSEKFNALNQIAKKIVESQQKNQNDSIQSTLDSSELPEVMKPFVQVEIARLLRQPEGIIEGLKSNDSVVFNRAIKVKWFFNGSIETCMTIQYYQTHILPFISLQSRIKIIKTLADNLGEKPAIAEEFYTSLSGMYGEKQALPLLKACSELFIWDRITKDQVRLDNKIIRFLLYKYPELIVKYLKLSKISSDPFERNLKRVDLFALSNFLPRLVKKCPDTFVELIEMHNNLNFIRLSKTRTELFLVNCIDALMRNSKLFIPMLDLKTVTKKLKEDQFRIIFAQLFPQNFESFEFDVLLRWLNFFPEEQKLPLMMSTFEELYKINLLDCSEKITPTTLKLLPRDERIKQADIKLQKEPFDGCHCLERSWICYQSIEDSMKYLKPLIKKTSDAEERSHLLKKLLYTCIVNSDNNALLEVLKYITMRHKNERSQTLSDILDVLSTQRYLKNLEQEHWDVIYNLLKFLHVKSEFEKYSQTQITLLVSLIHFDLVNNHSITDKISLLAELFIDKFQCSLNILKDNIVYEKQCLEEFITVFSMKKPDDKNDLYSRVIRLLVESIYNFNKHNLKAKSPFQPMSIKNYPWILDALKKLLNANDDGYDYEISAIQEVLQKEEKDLYKALISEGKAEKELLFSDMFESVQLLKTSPEKFVHNWEYSLEKCIELSHNAIIWEFIKLSRWYQDLPIKFTEGCLRKIEENKEPRVLVILGLLLEGSAFEQIITPLLPPSATIDINQENAKRNYQMICYIPMTLNFVNPPTSLDLILKLCVGDYIHSIINYFVNISRRTSVAKVMKFAMTLMNRPVSIKKHGVRLFCLAANVKELRNTLSNLWRIETHPTIRKLVFLNIFKVFYSNPNEETWGMVKECIDDLKSDDSDTFKSLLKFNSVPNEYIVDYIEKLFSIFRKFENSKTVWNYIIQLLSVPNNISALFSEEQHDKIINSYVLDLSLPRNVLSAGHHYLINCYIVPAQNKLEERLNRFQDIFVKIVKNHWNVPQPDNPTFYPGNYFVHNLILENIYNLSNGSLKNRVVSVSLELFNSLLNPHHDPESFLYLTLFSVVQDKITSQEFVDKIATLLPLWIKVFSLEFISEIAKYLHHFLNDYPNNTWLNVIEALVALNVNETTILAAHLSLLSVNLMYDRFHKILEVLKNHQHPTVTSIAHILMHKIQKKK